MSILNFTAQASLYRSSRHYRGSATSPDGSPLGGSIVLAYRPLPATQIQCSQCNDGCDSDYEFCNSLITPLGVACSLFVPAACAAAAYAQLYCDAVYAGCRAYRLFGFCCPKACSVPDPSHPGEGCCEIGEHCVDQNDPNARSGCCPSDRHICGGKCCAEREVCCGDTCCPPDQPCFDGVCGVYPPLIPPGTSPPPTPPPPAGCPPGTWYNPSVGCVPVIH